VYTTAVQDNKFLQTLRIIPVSGIHQSLFDMDIQTDSTAATTNFFHYIITLKENDQAWGTPPQYIFTSIEASQMTSRTGKWYFLTTEDKYNSAIQFIDQHLNSLYYQSHFHKLPQTQKTPFHRGPHRLTKLSDAAKTHATHLTKQDIPDDILTRVPRSTRRAPFRVTYDTHAFPHLPQKRMQKSSPPTATPSTHATSVAPTPANSPAIDALLKRIEDMEDKMQAQREQIHTLSNTIKSQQEAIEKLLSRVEDHQHATTSNNEALKLMSTTVGKLERSISILIQQQHPSQDSPEKAQPLKRMKSKETNDSPSAIFQPLPEETMADTEACSSDSPNMREPDRRTVRFKE